MPTSTFMRISDPANRICEVCFSERDVRCGSTIEIREESAAVIAQWRCARTRGSELSTEVVVTFHVLQVASAMNGRSWPISAVSPVRQLRVKTHRLARPLGTTAAGGAAEGKRQKADIAAQMPSSQECLRLAALRRYLTDV